MNNRKWHWTRDEDKLLTILVHRYGAGNWDYIATHIEGRSGKSCRVRWINQLNPGIDKSPFTEEDHEKLLQLHRLYGNRWSTIATFFSGRTDNQLKNLYHVLSRGQNTNYNPHHGNPYAISEGPLYEFAPMATDDSVQTVPYSNPTEFEEMSSKYDGPTLPYSSAFLGHDPNNTITVPYHAPSTSNASDVGFSEQVETLEELEFIDFLGVENAN